MTSSPRSTTELLDRARAIEGLPLGRLARACGETLRVDPVRTKGRIGEMIERVLGASAKSLDLPDFPDLGVELKTIPLDRAGRVRESTHVCAIDLGRAHQEEWETCRLWRKLRRVLWIPIEAEQGKPLVERRVGRPLLWEPDAAEEELLRSDWTLLIGRIAVGGVEELSAHWGEALQVRPKAADGSVRVLARGPDLEPIHTIPRGFYLRARYTERLLWQLTAAE